jgi:hypothetical protein
MPISDAYVVQYLVQETTASQQPLEWLQDRAECYTTTINGVSAELIRLSDRAGSRLFVTLEAYPERIEIGEPRKKGFFQPKYDSETDARIAELLHELATAVARQCSDRQNRSSETEDTIRESIYRRVIGAV